MIKLKFVRKRDLIKYIKNLFLIYQLANQFPKLQIVEVTNDYNILLPHFNKFLTKILNNMMH